LIRPTTSPIRLAVESLEHGKGAGKGPDFVMAFGISRVDGKIARRELQHGVANGMQRIDDAAAERHHADQGESESAASRDGWKTSDSSAADRSAKALLFASSSAGSVTVTALPMRPPVIGLH
jgi:hypothetical protein